MLDGCSVGNVFASPAYSKIADMIRACDRGAGAAAKRMMNLEEVTAVAQKAVDNTRTMGVALTPCIVPEVGKATFSVNEDEIEIGMGIHGEKGIEVRKMMTANEVADVVMEKVLSDLPIEAGEEIAVMVNGLGGTPLEELFVVYNRIKAYMPHIGEFATSMEMAGLSVSIMKLDEQLKELMADPANTPFYTNHNK